MDKQEAIRKFGKWGRVAEGFVFRRKDGSWDCCSRESPFGDALATKGVGEGLAAGILEFEAVSHDFAASLPEPQLVDESPKRVPVPKHTRPKPVQRETTQREAADRTRPRFKRSSILVGILLMIGGPLCVWISADMTTDIDKLINVRIGAAVIGGIAALSVGFLLLVVSLFRTSAASK